MPNSQFTDLNNALAALGLPPVLGFNGMRFEFHSDGPTMPFSGRLLSAWMVDAHHLELIVCTCPQSVGVDNIRCHVPSGVWQAEIGIEDRRVGTFLLAA